MGLKKNILPAFYFFSLAATGKGLSGGDRIFIEFARRWSKKFSVEIYTSEDGVKMCELQKLTGERLSIWQSSRTILKGEFISNYLYKIIKGIQLGFKLYIKENDILYPASDFWMDFFPALILKLRYPKSKLIASWYQTAPSPIKGYSQGDREKSYRVNALLYWLTQLPTKPLVERLADFVFINNEEEKKHFPALGSKNRAIVVLGAVNLKQIKEWIDKRKDKFGKKFDAVFQGRFHAQKGVEELIDTWKIVVDKKSDAKLAMIGDGPLMSNVQERIVKNNLEKNITLFGYLFDGDKKYSILQQSRVVLHPALYDSGGMAAAEAMAFGLPAVGFDLSSYKSYYPFGMVKVKIGDLEAFASVVLKLLGNKKYYKKISDESVEMIQKAWDWDIRADEVLSRITTSGIVEK